MKNNTFKEEIKQYFDKIALDLDLWNRRNRYYYQDIQKLHNFIIPSGSTVLEIGCGTGDLLAGTNPELGVGIDFSQQVISLAKDKYPHLNFYCLDAENINAEFLITHPISSGKFDFIILSGVLGYLTDIQVVMERLKVFCHPRTRIILVFHNFLWEPVLRFGEKINQRRPQPPQNWLSMNDMINFLSIL